jgi:D-amino-acid oxidase
MKIAVIGSGMFGSIISIVLSKKHKVDLFEKKKKILNNASMVNQFRFHLGFHYPRSVKTIREIKKSYGLFEKFFPKDIFGKTKNYYAVSKNDSKISFNKYLKILKKNKLKFKIIKNKKYRNISNLLLTNEKILNYFKFKSIIKKKLKKNKINLIFGRTIKKKEINNYDKIIICGYSNNNQILRKLNIKKLKKYRYELVEKIVIKLPLQYKNKSFVIMDGKFVSLDPYLGTQYHLLSDVKYSKIEVVKKIFPIFKSYKKKFINKGLIQNIKISNFSKFIYHSSKYLPFLRKSKYIGSFFTIRTLKENVEKTDERTLEIKKNTNKIMTIFSSKWNTSVNVANQILNIT